VHAVVERTVYIAEKNHYRQKSGGGDKPSLHRQAFARLR